MRILIGVLKGAIVGGLLGGVVWFLETSGDFSHEASWSSLRWPLYGTIGLLAGLVSGRPPWAKDDVRGAAWVASVFKGLIGFGLCVGLYFLGDWLLNFNFHDRPITTWYFGFGAVLGVIYSVFIEVDDSIGKKDAEKKAAPKSEAITPAKDAKKYGQSHSSSSLRSASTYSGQGAS